MSSKSKKLNLDTELHEENEDMFLNIKRLIKNYSTKFNVSYRDKTIPIIIRYKQTTNIQLCNISIAYMQTPDMDYPTLLISLKQKLTNHIEQDDVHIEYVNKNDELNLSGSYIIDFAIHFLKLLGAKYVTLIDAAYATDDIGCSLMLTPYMMLKKSTTFYGKWGFLPHLDENSLAYDDSQQMLSRLCKLVAMIQKIKIQSMLKLLQQVNALFVKFIKPKNKQELVTYSIKTFLSTGVPAVQTYKDDWTKIEIQAGITMNNEIYNALEKYKDKTIQEMVEVCSCYEFNKLQQFFLFIPTVVALDKKSTHHKYKHVYDEFYDILRKNEYILDLTIKPRNKTCS